MRIERRDGTIERRIVTAMVTDAHVLGTIASRWQNDLFRSKWSNLVGGWCVKFHQRYDKPPGKAIEGIFESWASKAKDEETIKLVEKFLGSLSDQYESNGESANSQFLIDQAAELFNRVRLSRLAEGLQADLDANEPQNALDRVLKYDRVEMGLDAGTDVLSDLNAIREAFAARGEPLITYPGALGTFFGDALERDALISFMGPEKIGKTWMLLDMAWRGISQRRKVAFFEIGDMSKHQIMRRFMVRATKRPLRAGTVKYPHYMIRNPEELFAEVDVREQHFAKPVSWQVAWKACQKIMTDRIKSKESLLKLYCCPNSTITVAGIRSVLDQWARQGWVPDVVIVDYADILAPPMGIIESRDQINASWKQLRALSQSLHCLVVTATQSNAASYNAQVVDRRHFSEDKRKLAHVNGMIGLSTTPGEKERGVVRLSWVELREGAFSDRVCCHVAGCLALANPAIKSCF